MVTQADFVIFGVAMVLTLFVVPGVLFSVRSMRRSGQMISRLERAKATAGSSAEDKRTKSIGDIVTDLGRRSTPGNPEQISQLRFTLMRAGLLGQKAVSVYFAARLLMVVLPQILLLYLVPQLSLIDPILPLSASLFLAIFGLTVPGIYIGKRTKRLEREYKEGFPDMMDLLVACVEAGMSIDAAVARVAEELAGRYPSLALHLKINALELRAGRARQDAWKNFARRLGIEEASSLTTMLRQAEEMGSSIGDTLRVFSKDMRKKRMLAAEEQAMALSAKLSLPLILFVFPTLLGVLILPAIVRALELAA
ncbi:MAG: type II secretion system F family protein [Hyphomonadaceae bacterium]